MSEARSWSNTPPCEVDGRQAMVAVVAPGRRGDGQLQWELTPSWLIGYQGN